MNEKCEIPRIQSLIKNKLKVLINSGERTDIYKMVFVWATHNKTMQPVLSDSVKYRKQNGENVEPPRMPISVGNV